MNPPDEAAAVATSLGAASIRQAAELLINSRVPTFQVAVRSSGRAALLAGIWSGSYSLFVNLSQEQRPEGPVVWVDPAEASTYRKHIDVLEPGGKGPGGQVSAMLVRAPRGSWVIVLDDNIKTIRFRGKPVEPRQLMSLLRQGMTTPGLCAFAAVPLSSKWGRATRAGLTIRQSELTGGLFALRVPPEMSGEDYASIVEPQHGVIADDLERSLRVYHEGGHGCMGLFHELTVEKYHEPGVWKRGSGGIAARFSDSTEFQKAKDRNLDRLSESFPEIMRQKGEVPNVQRGWKWGSQRGW